MPPQATPVKTFPYKLDANGAFLNLSVNVYGFKLFNSTSPTLVFTLQTGEVFQLRRGEGFHQEHIFQITKITGGLASEFVELSYGDVDPLGGGQAQILGMGSGLTAASGGALQPVQEWQGAGANQSRFQTAIALGANGGPRVPALAEGLVYAPGQGVLPSVMARAAAVLPPQMAGFRITGQLGLTAATAGTFFTMYPVGATSRLYLRRIRLTFSPVAMTSVFGMSLNRYYGLPTGGTPTVTVAGGNSLRDTPGLIASSATLTTYAGTAPTDPVAPNVVRLGYITGQVGLLGWGGGGNGQTDERLWDFSPSDSYDVPTLSGTTPTPIALGMRIDSISAEMTMFYEVEWAELPLT